VLDAGDEASRQHEIDRGEVEARAVGRGDREAGDHGVALVVLEGLGRLLPGPGLDGAGDVELAADGTGAGDGEADEFPGDVAVVEGREVARREEADGRYRGRRRGEVARAGIDVIGQRLREGSGRPEQQK